MRHIMPSHHASNPVSLHTGVTANPSLYFSFENLVFVMVADGFSANDGETEPPVAPRPHDSQQFLISSLIRGDGWSCGSVVHLPRLSLRA
jgi:hypothetical protein